MSRSPWGRLLDSHNGSLNTEKSGLSVEILPWTREPGVAILLSITPVNAINSACYEWSSPMHHVVHGIVYSVWCCCSMLLGLITERLGNFYHVYSLSGDFDIPLSECDRDYDVGKWLGLDVRDNKLSYHNLALLRDLPDLPPVRVYQGVAEVLTTGSIIWREGYKSPFCATTDFGTIPILVALPNSAQKLQEFHQVWVRSLSKEERENFGGHSQWGVVEFILDVQQARSCSRSRASSDVENEAPSTRHCGSGHQGVGGGSVVPVQESRNHDVRPSVRENNVHLLGLIISPPVKSLDNDVTASIWSRRFRGGRGGVLYYGSDTAELSAFRHGDWIDFSLPFEYIRHVQDCGERFEVPISKCKVVQGPFPTRTTKNSVELKLTLSVPVGHRIGDNFDHEELGAICDEQKLLEGGQAYEAIVGLVRPGQVISGNEMAEWRVVSAEPVGESWAPHFSRKVSKVKRPLPGKAKSRPIQRSNNAAAISTNAAISPRSSPENITQKQNDDGVDQSSLDRGSYVVEPKHLDYSERQSVTANITHVKFCPARETPTDEAPRMGKFNY
ncbi:hypothetical protein Y032_0854g2703 [Ancylostoma ceylanicum]|nr:hypothetical protein Y032_0854g2703 [Ancylostoma ceylanicum]